MASNGEEGLPREHGASEKGSKKRSRKGEGSGGTGEGGGEWRGFQALQRRI